MKNNELEVILTYIQTPAGFRGTTVKFLRQNYSVTVLGKHSKEKIIDIAVHSWLDNN